MKSSLRPTTAADLGAVREFLRGVFNCGDDAPFLEPRLMAWKYWDRRDDEPGPRSYVMERDDRIIAHTGVYPLRFGEVRGVQLIDWASSKEHPGAGLAILQKMDSMFDFIYSIGGSEMTRSILPAFGFVEWGNQWRAAVPVRPFRQMATHQSRNRKLAPRLARNFAWSRAGAEVGGDYAKWKSAKIRPDELPGELCPIRSAGFFEYLLRCPGLSNAGLYGVRNEHGVQGHFALGETQRQVRVAGVWIRDASDDGLQTMYALARKAAAKIPGACEVALAGTGDRSPQAAMKAGFRMLGSVPIYLRNRKGKLRLPADFQFQLSDDDSFFLGSGAPDYWT